VKKAEQSLVYRAWEQAVPPEIKNDSVWKAEAYRLALFASELAWRDSTKLLSDKRTLSIADQLYRSVGAVSADIEEGYSRGTGKDRARFYEYGLGSAREARGWYFKSRYVLGEKVLNHRLSLLTQIIKLLLAMVPDQRGQLLREEPVSYFAQSKVDGFSSDLADLLENIPLP
jgi:four helix bundle protein